LSESFDDACELFEESLELFDESLEPFEELESDELLEPELELLPSEARAAGDAASASAPDRRITVHPRGGQPGGGVGPRRGMASVLGR
jgi:hypothetical protein